MPDIALASAYPAIARSIVRIVVERQHRTTLGTGFIVGFLNKERRAIVATAGHVVPQFLDEHDGPTRITFQRFNQVGSAMRTLSFVAEVGKATEGVNALWSTSPGADTAGVILRRLADDGSEFLEPDERGVALVGGTVTAAPATRVAWAGFPGLLEKPEMLGFPQLCYFEGVVSALVNRENRQLLVIDGHAMPGVSGGPVWFEHDSGRVEVIGLMSAYAGHKVPEKFHPDLYPHDHPDQKRDRMPGFCFAQPINPLLNGIKKTLGSNARPTPPA